MKAPKNKPKSGVVRDSRYDELFDFAAPTPKRKAPKAGYIANILRGGGKSSPVFSEKGGGAAKLFANLANMGLSIASDEAQKALSTGGGIEKKRALSESLVMGFSAHGRRIPESKLAADSPKRVPLRVPQ